MRTARQPDPPQLPHHSLRVMPRGRDPPCAAPFSLITRLSELEDLILQVAGWLPPLVAANMLYLSLVSKSMRSTSSTLDGRARWRTLAVHMGLVTRGDRTVSDYRTFVERATNIASQTGVTVDLRDSLAVAWQATPSRRLSSCLSTHHRPERLCVRGVKLLATERELSSWFRFLENVPLDAMLRALCPLEFWATITTHYVDHGLEQSSTEICLEYAHTSLPRGDAPHRTGDTSNAIGLVSVLCWLAADANLPLLDTSWWRLSDCFHDAGLLQPAAMWAPGYKAHLAGGQPFATRGLGEVLDPRTTKRMFDIEEAFVPEGAPLHSIPVDRTQRPWDPPQAGYHVVCVSKNSGDSC